jgi:hypothetical protein
MKRIFLSFAIFCSSVLVAQAQSQPKNKRILKPAKTPSIEKNCCDTLSDPDPQNCCPYLFKQKTVSTSGGNTTGPTVNTTNNKTIKDPFTPGSPDDDVRNPFDTTKKIKPAVVQPATNNQQNKSRKNNNK